MDSQHVDAQHTNERIFATFFVDGLEFALDVGLVQDAVFNSKKIVPLPATADYLKGITSVRGNIVPVIDIRKRFRMPTPSQPQDDHIAITRCKGRLMGLIFERPSPRPICSAFTVYHAS